MIQQMGMRSGSSSAGVGSARGCAAFTFLPVGASDIHEWRRRARQRAGVDLERKTGATLRAVISGEACGPYALPGGRAALPERTHFLSGAKAREFIKRKSSGCLTDWRERSFHTLANTSYST